MLTDSKKTENMKEDKMLYFLKIGAVLVLIHAGLVLIDNIKNSESIRIKIGNFLEYESKKNYKQ